MNFSLVTDLQALKFDFFLQEIKLERLDVCY